MQRPLVFQLPHMTRTGVISRDLSNYDDDAAGGSAWPCAIDEFVEYVQAQNASEVGGDGGA